jgi:branched-chain amino acid transport system permease protein
MRRLATPAAVFALAAVAVAVLPHLVSDFHAFQLANVGIYFIALVGLNVLTGSSGQISLGHGAFMAIGGYTSAILMANHGVRDLWTIPLAGLVAGGAGLLVGLPATRLSGLYLALVTFGIAVSFPQLLKKFEGFTGGTTGLILNLPAAPFGLHTSSNRWLYYLTWGLALVLAALAWALLRGRFGRALRAIRDSEVAAASSGIDLALYKTLAFGISAFYAGVAGSLFAIATAYVNPDAFPVTLSVVLVVGLVVGGLGSLPGLVLGAAFIVYLPVHSGTLLRWFEQVVPVDVSPKAPGVPSVIYGAVVILVLLVLPRGAGGLLGLTSRLYTRSYRP